MTQNYAKLKKKSIEEYNKKQTKRVLKVNIKYAFLETHSLSCIFFATKIYKAKK